MASLSIMQYIGAAPRRTPSQLTRGQRASLRFFCEVLPELKPHVIKLGGDGRRPVLVFSDARYEEDDESGYPAAVGFVVGVPNDGAPSGPPPPGSELVFLAEHYSWSHGSAYVPEAILAALLQRILGDLVGESRRELVGHKAAEGCGTTRASGP